MAGECQEWKDLDGVRLTNHPVRGVDYEEEICLGNGSWVIPDEVTCLYSLLHHQLVRNNTVPCKRKPPFGSSNDTELLIFFFLRTLSVSDTVWPPFRMLPFGTQYGVSPSDYSVFLRSEVLLMDRRRKNGQVYKLQSSWPTRCLKGV